MDGTLTVAVHDFPLIRRELGIPDGADILGHINALPETQRIASHLKLDELELHFAKQVRPAAGLYELMDKLAALGCRLGIVTRNTLTVSRHSLSTLSVDHYFKDGLIIGRDEAIPKPDPDGLHAIMDHWQVNPKECVMVGDYRHDLLAGKKSGCKTVHVLEDSGINWPELTDYRVSSLGELTQLL